MYIPLIHFFIDTSFLQLRKSHIHKTQQAHPSKHARQATKDVNLATT